MDLSGGSSRRCFILGRSWFSGSYRGALGGLLGVQMGFLGPEEPREPEERTRLKHWGGGEGNLKLQVSGVG